MRPEVLFPLFASLTSLSGVGPKMEQNLEKLTGPHVSDLTRHLPVSIIDRSHRPLLKNATPNQIATVTVDIVKHFTPPNKRVPYRIQCRDDSGSLTLIFFRAHADYLLKKLPVGETRLISGKIETYDGELQMTHPDYMVTPDQSDSIPSFEAVYPLTAGVGVKQMQKAITQALTLLPDLPEWLDPGLIKQHQWPQWKTAMLTAHSPRTIDDLDPLTPVRQRLAYDELFANQLALALVRRQQRKLKGQMIVGNGQSEAKILKAFKYTPTQSQITAYNEIKTDMASTDRMLRLLQGDVGSGKTLVAIQAMAGAVDAGFQAALMVPTEILAHQHLTTIQPLAEQARISIVLLTGRDKGKKRQEKLELIKSGKADFIIGTHALFQDDVEFQKLGLAVIDEQHRFGVHQRLTLTGKGRAVDVLVLTATPIPRTLMLTSYGDMDVSRLLEKPAGRLPVDTRIFPTNRAQEIAMGLKRAIQKGERVYWVCPLVEQSDKLDIAAAEDRYLILKSYYGDRVGLVHGRMKAADKDTVMHQFINGGLDILIATSVIEVGVDVPEASIMIIEHAERFGLAQLHQLRGRIGRGDKPSSCLLLYGPQTSATGRERLKTLRETEDGFIIAEKDLKLRGAGELLGTRQSGLPEFKLADLNQHADLLAVARRDAEKLLSIDPDLNSTRAMAARTLLYLFECDNAIRNLRSG